MSEISNPKAVVRLEKEFAEAHAHFFLDEEVADWKAARGEHGEKLQATRLLRVMSGGKPHNLVWLWRRGIDNLTGQPYEFCQAVCKCVTQSADPADMTPMFSCNGWQQGMLTRASEVREEEIYTPIGHMLQTYHDLGSEVTKRIDAAEGIHQMIEGVQVGKIRLDDFAEAMLFYMRIDKVRPFYWAGNGYSGGFQITPMSVLTGHDVSEVVDKAHELQEEGWVDFDGQHTISLAS